MVDFKVCELYLDSKKSVKNLVFGCEGDETYQVVVGEVYGMEISLIMVQELSKKRLHEPEPFFPFFFFFHQCMIYHQQGALASQE